jgi:hypothetical protein
MEVLVILFCNKRLNYEDASNVSIVKNQESTLKKAVLQAFENNYLTSVFLSEH